MQAKEVENHARVVAAVEQNRKNLRRRPDHGIPMEGYLGRYRTDAEERVRQ